MPNSPAPELRVCLGCNALFRRAGRYTAQCNWCDSTETTPASADDIAWRAKGVRALLRDPTIAGAIITVFTKTSGLPRQRK